MLLNPAGCVQVPLYTVGNSLGVLMNRLTAGVAVLGTVVLFAHATKARDLTFEDRVKAQEAIERVYYSHQIGPTKTFEEAVPRAVIEKKVRAYLRQSVALETLWHASVTAETLHAEVERMTVSSRMPERLRELEAALGNDPFLVRECIARPILVDRLARGLFEGDTTIAAMGWDTWWNEIQSSLNESSLVPPDLRDLPVAPKAFGIPPLSNPVQTSEICVPIGRFQHSAIWTGDRMIVWGGYNVDGALGSGGSYDAVAATWTSTTLSGAPRPRAFHTAVWTGSRMIVWGGQHDRGFTQSGGVYDPATDSFTEVSMVGAPTARSEHTAVWTGTEMLIWGGGSSGPPPITGGRYDPATDTWTSMSTVGAPTERLRHTAVWTGSKMIVFGGVSGAVPLATGGIYDPATDTWTAMAPINGPGRAGHTAIWTGSEMIVWGGGGPDQKLLDTGARYQPSSDRWIPISPMGAPTPRGSHTSVWTGTELIVWGGTLSSKHFTDTGGRYSPATNTWRATSTVGAPSARTAHRAVWTGGSMIVWGGVDDQHRKHYRPLDSGGVYDPATDTWTATAGGPTCTE
jgi:N-acetylneuraminic acid mutarotase